MVGQGLEHATYMQIANSYNIQNATNTKELRKLTQHTLTTLKY